MRSVALLFVVKVSDWSAACKSPLWLFSPVGAHRQTHCGAEVRDDFVAFIDSGFIDPGEATCSVCVFVCRSIIVVMSVP